MADLELGSAAVLALAEERQRVLLAFLERPGPATLEARDAGQAAELEGLSAVGVLLGESGDLAQREAARERARECLRS